MASLVNIEGVYVAVGVGKSICESLDNLMGQMRNRQGLDSQRIFWPDLISPPGPSSPEPASSTERPAQSNVKSPAPSRPAFPAAPETNEGGLLSTWRRDTRLYAQLWRAGLESECKRPLSRQDNIWLLLRAWVFVAHQRGVQWFARWPRKTGVRYGKTSKHSRECLRLMRSLGESEERSARAAAGGDCSQRTCQPGQAAGQTSGKKEIKA